MMSLKQLFGEERGVSPVIGVILMVAITVILAAVIGSFVLGIGGSQNAAPQVAFACEDGNLVHNGGEELVDSELTLSNGTDVDGGPYTAGDTVVFSFAPSNNLIWENPDSDESQILREDGCS